MKRILSLIIAMVMIIMCIVSISAEIIDLAPDGYYNPSCGGTRYTGPLDDDDYTTYSCHTHPGCTVEWVYFTTYGHPYEVYHTEYINHSHGEHYYWCDYLGAVASTGACQ